MESTKPENTTSPSSSADAELKAATQTSEKRVYVEAPASGEVKIVDVQNVDEIAFKFDLSQVRITAIDVDLVLIFPDNSKVILPGLAMELIGTNAPRLRALNKSVDAQDIIASISTLNLSDTTPSIHLASSDFLPKKQGGNSAQDQASADGSENAEASPAAANIPVITPVRPTVNLEEAANSASGARVEVVEAGSIAGSKLNTSGASGEPPAPKNPPSSIPSQGTSAAQGNAPFSMNAAELTIRALSIAEKTETTQSDGKIITGGAGAAQSETDSSFAAQSARESLAGGDGNDIVYADNPRFAASGTAARLLDVTVTMPTTNVSASRATISGLPSGYSILNAENVNGNWVMPVGTLRPNNFQIQLVYKIPDDAERPDANGFYNRFTMSITFNGTNAAGANGTISASAVVGVRDVNSEGDQNFIDPATGKPVIILFRQPAGNDIDAGAGNDTVYAAAGADSIDGGTGNNRVHYGNSQSGVSVNLASGTGEGGFAEGDQLENVQGLDGSKFADTLIGNAEANTLAGGAGADSLDGGSGADIADYSSSNAAVSVNLATGVGIGGDAQDDKLANIEQIIGSHHNDLLIADENGASLWGNKGDDTLVSGEGADRLDGGEGNNTADYRNSDAGVTVNLNTSTGSGGFADGDVLIQIDNISGSNHADLIIGNHRDNVIRGGGDNDTIDSGSGNDTLYSDGGNDSLIGGAGHDLFITNTGSSTLVGGDGLDTFNGTDGHATVDYTYSSSGVVITLNDNSEATSFISNADRDVLIGIKDIIGTQADDIINANALNNSLAAGSGDDFLSGGAGNDTLSGDADDDLLLGGAGDDSILGGTGNDTISGGTGADTLDGGTGINQLSFDYAAGNIGATIVMSDNGMSSASLGVLDQDQFTNFRDIIATRFADSIIGDSASNILNAGLGNDTIIGGLGNDTIIGGGGVDFVDYSASVADVSVNLVTGLASGTDIGSDVFDSISGVAGGSGADTITGNDASNLIMSGAGNNVIFGSAGFVTLNGGTAVNVTGLATGDQDSIRNFEHVIGTNFNDSIGGDANANSLSGAGGHDTLSGGLGNDTLDGGAGNDCIIGTGGSDILRGGANNDYMLVDQSFLGGGGSIDGGTGMDTVAFAANSGNLTLTNANFDSIVTNVEVLDFTSVGTNVTMSLNATDIASLTGNGLGTSNILDIYQNAGDAISIAAQAGYSFSTSSNNGVTTYTFYNDTDPQNPANQLAQINVHG